jgi:ribonuclease HI
MARKSKHPPPDKKTYPQQDKIVRIYSDGSYYQGRHIGGYGAVLTFNGHEKEIAGRSQNSSSARMELVAALFALRILKHNRHVVHVYSDSQYLINGASKWCAGWLRNKSNSAGIKNLDLWTQIHEQIQKHTIHWHWIKGHNGHRMNERADKLAEYAALGQYAEQKLLEDSQWLQKNAALAKKNNTSRHEQEKRMKAQIRKNQVEQKERREAERRRNLRLMLIARI